MHLCYTTFNVKFIISFGFGFVKGERNRQIAQKLVWYASYILNKIVPIAQKSLQKMNSSARIKLVEKII